MQTAFILGTGVVLGGGPGNAWDEVQTPYGPAWLCEHRIGNTDVVLLRRHGPGLNIPPHLINYKANIHALLTMGVKRIIATAATGSLSPDIAPGSLAVAGDFIDWTRNRITTIYDRPMEAVAHTDFTVPYCPEISSALLKAARNAGADVTQNVTYVCTDGPRYETPAEVRMLGMLGGDVVGMTGVPEVTLAREMGICYGTLCIVSNYAAGISAKPLSHSEVLVCVEEKGPVVRSVLEGALSYIGNEECENCRLAK
jgi:5'-methylthioadenosine phosphorylase